MVGEFGEVQVMDWGLARVITGNGDPGLESSSTALAVGLDPCETLEGAILGTPVYMSPEQAAGKISELDERADIYALGALLYEILALQPPFSGLDTQSILAEVKRGLLVPPSVRAPERAIPWELEAVAIRAMARRPADRYASVTELKTDIEAYLAGRILGAVEYSPLQRSLKWMRRNRSATIAAAIIVVVAVSLFGGFRWKADRDQRLRIVATEQALLTEADQLGRELDLRRKKLDRLERPDARSLREPNGELVDAAVKHWFDAHAEALEILDRLAALARRAPTQKSRKKLDPARIDRERRTLSLAASRKATELGNDTLARLWVGRALAAGMSVAERDAQLARIKGARRERVQSDLTPARRVLQRVSEGKASQSFDISVTELVRLRSPDLVRLLLSPEYLESRHEIVRLVVIETLGRIGDTRTVGPRGHDPVQALSGRLKTIDLDAQLEAAVGIALALGKLRDSRAHDVLGKKRWESGQESLFWKRTELPFSRVPLPAAYADGAAKGGLSAAQHYSRGLYRMMHRDWQNALRDFDRAIALRPKNFEAYNNRGLARQKLGDLVGARSDYDQSIQLNPQYAKAYNNRGSLQLKSGSLDLAVKDFSRAMTLWPGHPGFASNRGLAYEALGQLDRAIGDYTRAIRSRPGFAAAFNNRGNAKRKRGQLAQAIADYTEAIRLAPQYAPPYSNRANAHVLRGEFDRAVEDCTRALKIDPTFVGAYLNRGCALSGKGRHRRAITEFDLALKLDPKLASAYFNRANSLRYLGRLDRALADYDRALALEQRNAAYHHNRARTRKQRGDLDGAIADYDRALAISPKDPEIYNNRAAAKLAKGDLPGADADYSAAIALDSKMAAFYYNRAVVRETADKLDAAIKDLNQAIALDPNDPDSYNNRGRARLTQKKFDVAIADFTRAIALASRKAGFRNNRARAYFAKGEFAKSVADYERAVALDPKLWQAWVGMGLALRERGTRRAARRAFGKALKLAPEEKKPKIAKMLRELK